MMPVDDIYERWREARADVEVPNGFADRVMIAVETSEEDARDAATRGVLALLLASRLARVAVYSIAGGACLMRIGCVVSTFIAF